MGFGGPDAFVRTCSEAFCSSDDLCVINFVNPGVDVAPEVTTLALLRLNLNINSLASQEFSEASYSSSLHAKG